MKDKSKMMSVFADHMNSSAFLWFSFFLVIVFIKEKSIMLFNKSQFCALEMENDYISLFIQAVKI